MTRPKVYTPSRRLYDPDDLSTKTKRPDWLNRQPGIFCLYCRKTLRWIP